MICQCGLRFHADRGQRIKCPDCGLESICNSGRHAADYRAIIASAAATKRLIHWLTFFRHAYEAGVGDTVARLLPLAKQGSDLRAALEQLNRQCGCKPREARHELNRQYPYYQT